MAGRTALYDLRKRRTGDFETIGPECVHDKHFSTRPRDKTSLLLQFGQDGQAEASEQTDDENTGSFI